MLFPPLISLGRTSRPKLNWKRNSGHMFPVTRRETFTRALVPNLFGTRDWFHGRQFFHRQGRMVISGWIKVKVKVSQSCPTLYNPMDCSLPGSSVHGILQARILEWVPCLPPGDLPNPGIKYRSSALQADSLLSESTGMIQVHYIYCALYFYCYYISSTSSIRH